MILSCMVHNRKEEQHNLYHPGYQENDISHCEFCFCLLPQMSSLVRLQLLTVVGDGHIDLPRYKCSVDFEFVSTVARLVAKQVFSTLLSI